MRKSSTFLKFLSFGSVLLSLVSQMDVLASDQSIKESEVYVDWLIESPITSDEFPVTLFSTAGIHNYSINTSWEIVIDHLLKIC